MLGLDFCYLIALMILDILDYQIGCDKPSEETHIADLYVAWYIFPISSSGDTTICQ
jgi:ABC-type antimicrobial peptide transport system permease subunit